VNFVLALALSAQVTAATQHFLTAFENLDWQEFRSSFADDACVFFPRPDTPELQCGREAYEKQWRRVFDEEKKGKLVLSPEDLRVQMLGEDAAVVTFHLRNPQRIARRSFVFRRIAGEWKIAHLHASNIAH
jgi:ketosteroid isomerase-like protein